MKTMKSRLMGKKLEENYVKGRTIEIRNKPAEFPQIIPEGYVFVMGDNREKVMTTTSSGGLISAL